MAIKAVNNYIFVIRDKVELEESGLIIPSAGRIKPHQGEVLSIGSLVKDREIKGSKGKKVLFHKGVGFEIDFEAKTYLVLNEAEVIAIV